MTKPMNFYPEFVIVMVFREIFLILILIGKYYLCGFLNKNTLIYAT